MLTRLISIVVLALALVSCGNASSNYFGPNIPTGTTPIISRVDPNFGSAGDEITIFGLGYSIAFPENIIIIGGAATTATSYRLLSNPTSSEIEALTAIVPADAQLGEGPIYVLVDASSSNTDVSFTVTP